MTPLAGLVCAISDRRFRVAESPLWDDRRGCAFFVDVKGHVLCAFDPETGDLTDWPLSEDVGFVALTDGDALVLGMRSGPALFDPATGALQPLLTRPLPPEERVNDGKVDAVGTLWFGTMRMDGRAGGGALWRLATGGSPERVATGYGVPNGPAFAADGGIYHAATDAGRIDRHGSDSVPPSVFAQLTPAEGRPDGLAVDGAGRLWCGLWGGGGVMVFEPDGTRRALVPVPATYVTAIAAVGRDGAQALVTSAYLPLERGEPGPRAQEGCVFLVPLVTPWPVLSRRFLRSDRGSTRG